VSAAQRAAQRDSPAPASAIRRPIDQSSLSTLTLATIDRLRQIVPFASHGRLRESSETANETRRRSWVMPHSFPSTAGGVYDRLSELTPLPEVVNEARDVCHPALDAPL
jgi:hypothetical protein